MTTIGISRLHWPVSVLGPGLRVGIWVQGCSIECPGCVSRDTWPTAGEDELVGISALMGQIDRLVVNGDPRPVDGITVTGGEPFDQPEALEALLGELRGWLDDRARPQADLLVYTGYDESEARERCRTAFSMADALIVGPYQASQPGGRWWGSANQRLIAKSEEVRVRYETALREAKREMQVTVRSGQVFIIGIPHRHTLAGVESHLADRGIGLQGVSWRP